MPASAASIFPRRLSGALMCSLAAANATKHIDIATWIVKGICATRRCARLRPRWCRTQRKGASFWGWASSHRPALEARGIEMGNARDRLRNDTEIIRKAFNGELSMFGTKFPKPAHPIPIYFAALALETAKLAGEMADGLMLYMCPPERMRKSIDAANKVAKEKGRAPGSLTMTCGVPLFLHDDLKTAYEAAPRDSHSTARCRSSITSWRTAVSPMQTDASWKPRNGATPMRWWRQSPTS